MKKILIEIDDTLYKELKQFPNMSEIVRNSLRVYIQHISTDTIEGMRASYKLIRKEQRHQTEILNYIAGKLE